MSLNLFQASDGSDSASASQREMNGCAIRTVVKLFDRLELQPTETASEEESDHTAARHFNRYFNFLYKMSKLPDSLVRSTTPYCTLFIE